MSEYTADSMLYRVASCCAVRLPDLPNSNPHGSTFRFELPV